MKVEILGVDDQIARVRVSDGDRHCEFACSSPEPAHQLLRQMIRNAARQIAEMRVREQMDQFERGVRQL